MGINSVATRYIRQNNPYRSVAGIIPVSGNNKQGNFNMLWDECLIPVSQGYTAIERAVLECLCAGCSSIWIVCNDNMGPAIRNLLGEFATDPMQCAEGFCYKDKIYKNIPIFYVPINPLDLNKRDSYGWSILWGAYSAFRFAKQVSVFMAPKWFYVCFPYSVIEPRDVMAQRKNIYQMPTYLMYDGKTILDDVKLSFTFSPLEYDACKAVCLKGKKSYDFLQDEEGNITKKWYPKEERNEAKNFPLSKIFASLPQPDEETCHIIKPSFFHDIETWDGYRKYMASGNSVEKPSSLVLRYREWNPVSLDQNEYDGLVSHYKIKEKK